MKYDMIERFSPGKKWQGFNENPCKCKACWCKHLGNKGLHASRCLPVYPLSLLLLPLLLLSLDDSAAADADDVAAAAAAGDDDVTAASDAVSFRDW